MAKTGYGNFVIKFTSPWRGTPHVWSIASSHSGSAFATEASAIAFVQAVATTISDFISPGASTTFISGWKYYNGTDSATLYEADYANAGDSTAAGWPAAENFGDAYTSGFSTVSGLEACVLLEAPIGLSKTGKPVTMRKFIHAVPAADNTADEPPFGSAAAPSAAALGSGGLPGNRVLVSPKGAQGYWTVSPYYVSHKMSRKRKKTTGSSLFAGLAKDLGESAAAKLLQAALSTAEDAA